MTTYTVFEGNTTLAIKLLSFIGCYFLLLLLIQIDSHPQGDPKKKPDTWMALWYGCRWTMSECYETLQMTDGSSQVTERLEQDIEGNYQDP